MTPLSAVALVFAVGLSFAYEVTKRPVPWWAMVLPLVGQCVLAFSQGGVGDLETGFTAAALGAAACGATWALMKWLGRLEWADVGLMSVAGASFALSNAPAVLMFVSIAGALQAVATTLLSGDLKARLQKAPESVPRPVGRKIPYAVAVAVGSAATWWWLASTPVVD